MFSWFRLSTYCTFLECFPAVWTLIQLLVPITTPNMKPARLTEASQKPGDTVPLCGIFVFNTKWDLTY